MPGIPRRSSVVVDGLRSPLIEAGDPDASEAVVFSHGSPGCAEEFTRLVERTGEFARALAIDSPGFGGADKPDPGEFDYSVPNLGVHLAKQLEQLGVERAHFVGHDFGGGFNLLAAAYNPQTVASMSMINAGLMRGTRWHAMARMYRTPVVAAIFIRIANEWGFKRALGELPAADVDLMWRNFDMPTRRAIVSLYRKTDIERQVDLLPQVRLVGSQWPALVIFGEDDPFLPAALAERNKEALQRAEVHLIAGAGHWPHLEAPDRVEELLVPFLREQVGAAVAV